ncbi:MAG: substrate-binding periplasmic protein [Cellvibrionaceae bacterium]
MKSWLSITLLLVITSFASAEQSLSRAPITAATSDGWAPYEFYDPNTKRMTGYSTEVIRAVLAKMNRPLAPIQSLPWTRAQEMLFSGELDLLYSATPSPNRLQLARVTPEPIVTSHWVLFVLIKHRAQLTYGELSDLIGHRIGTVQGYTYTPEFWHIVRTQAVTNPVLTDEQNFKMLMQGRVDFVIAELANGLEIIHQLNIEDQVMALRENPVRTTTLHPVFSRHNITAETVERFSQELRAFKQTEQHHQLYKKFFQHLEMPKIQP